MADSKKSASVPPSGVKPAGGGGESVQLGTPPSAEERAAKGGGVAQIPAGSTPGESRGTQPHPEEAQQATGSQKTPGKADATVPDKYKQMGPQYHVVVGVAKALGGNRWELILNMILALIQTLKASGILDENPPVEP